MKIRGVVEKEAAINGNEVKYQVNSNGSSYDIISKEKQAVKDLIFLRKGQNVEVEAFQKDNRYISQGSVIDIHREADKNENK